jgi:riboflavin synthase
MFTGIISNLGKIKAKNDTGFVIEADNALAQKLEDGTSISVNGVCLTVLEKPIDTVFTVEVMPETWKRTMLQDLHDNDVVNLELPVTPQTFLSGHIVQGHVDGIGTLKQIEEKENSKILTLEVSQELTKYIVEKGSVAINGISLTVIDVTEHSFTVGIIPYTWNHTMLQYIQIGDTVNIETDILGKYILREERTHPLPPPMEGR